MSIQIYVKDDEKNETMYCTFTDKKITYELNDDILEVTNPILLMT